MAGVHPHELLPILELQLIQERVILDRASKRSRSFVIQEVKDENWGYAGVLCDDWKRQQQKQQQ